MRIQIKKNKYRFDENLASFYKEAKYNILYDTHEQYCLCVSENNNLVLHDKVNDWFGKEILYFLFQDYKFLEKEIMVLTNEYFEYLNSNDSEEQEFINEVKTEIEAMRIKQKILIAHIKIAKEMLKFTEELYNKIEIEEITELTEDEIKTVCIDCPMVADLDNPN